MDPDAPSEDRYDPARALAAAEAQARARGVVVVDKRASWHQRAIDRALRILSLGRMDGYLTRYVTTIGRRVYVPPDWASWPVDDRVEILRHELVHVGQFERYGLVPMALAYLLFPLPVGLAWARMRLEREAYAESLRAAFERGGRAAAEAMVPDLIRRFSGPDYLWMWPFPRQIQRWADQTIDQLEHGGRSAAS